MGRVVVIVFFVLLAVSSFTLAEEPALPAGLGEPSLPSGLGSLPALPSGLSSDPEDDWDDEEDEWQEEETWQTDGFWETRIGEWRDQKDYHNQNSIAEMRFHMNADRAFDSFTLNLSGDLLYDNEADTHRAKLETGEGWFDLRSANVIFSPNSIMDVRVGRQILTWGTGDLIFINDLFPKDWNSFLIGRDDTYLKAPSDAAKFSMFSEGVNVDLVYTPRFDSDRYISGERASYYNAGLGRIAGTDAVVSVDKPDEWFEDDEVALRLYRNVATFELAFYGYNGYWKSPGGVDPVTGNAIFPRLAAYGTSLRGPLLGGIVSGELGYYDSKDDDEGNNPLINNSEQRLLLGYERELVANLTLGLQFYTTRMLDYGAYKQTLPAGMPRERKNRHEVTSRLTWLAMSQKLTTSLYIRYSSTDKDYYLRPKVRYSVDDHWSYEVGANIFHGDKHHTFLGQFEENDNIYVALRYGL